MGLEWWLAGSVILNIFFGAAAYDYRGEAHELRRTLQIVVAEEQREEKLYEQYYQSTETLARKLQETTIFYKQKLERIDDPCLDRPASLSRSLSIEFAESLRRAAEARPGRLRSEP